VSSRVGGWRATSSLRSTAGLDAPPTRHSVPRRSHPAPLAAAHATLPPAPVQYDAGSREWACVPASPSRAAGPPRVSPYSPRLQTGERLLAWADRPPPLAPSAL
jgi:hypothetical protein